MVALFAAWHHRHAISELSRGGNELKRPSPAIIAVAVILAVFGLAMAIYLIANRVGEPKTAQGSENRSVKAIDGFVSQSSNHSVDQTVEKLKQMLVTKGLKLFALIDHSGEAEKVGLKMRPTKLLIFGNANAGTPLMVTSPSIAIDLPLKVLV
jgi:hypothetical protein